MRKFLLFAVPVIMLAASCRFGGGKKVEGNGNIKTEEKSVSEFSEIEVHGAIDVHISQGDLKPIRVEGDENLLQYIEVTQKGNRVEVRSRRGYNLRPSADMKIFVTRSE